MSLGGLSEWLFSLRATSERAAPGARDACLGRGRKRCVDSTAFPHWNTVIIDGSLPDDVIRDMIENSYDLVVSKLPPARRRELSWRGDA
jgi:hypothetical protein